MNAGSNDATASLPQIISDYLTASERGDIDAILACFTADALVIDEQREWQGAEAIRRWRGSVATTYEYTVQVTGSASLEAVDDLQRYEVYTHLKGNFPGGEVD